MTLKTKFDLVQNELDLLKTGHCFLIKLTNYDELRSVIDDTQFILSDFAKIVQEVFDLHQVKMLAVTEHDKILCILGNIDQALLNAVAFKIYYTCQLYTNSKITEAFMSCHSATIAFTEDNNSESLYASLIGLLSHFNNGRYYQEYNDDLHNVDLIKKSIKNLNMLRQSLKQKTIKFAYQPIVDSKTKKTHYYECLLRTPNEEGELISVGPIIEYAESTGLINIIDLLVLEMAINELIDNTDISLSVNISNLGIVDNHLLKLAETLLTKHNVASRLIIEITETALNKDYEKTAEIMNILHKFGCQFALDDFGSGFTSIQQLQKLPIDIIKIDGSYIRDINTNHHNKYFVENLVRLSEDLGIKTVAEFVEDGEIAKFLIDIKVDGLQGNFFSPALSTRK